MDFALIELFFFAYRDFVSEPDRILARDGFGRAHHRVMHFVNRHPGLTIAELLDILKITKQSLNRVLKDLIDQGHIEQRPGDVDRRQRLLFMTERGAALARELASMQNRRISGALALSQSGADRIVRQFLSAMVDAGERDKVRRVVAGGTGGKI
ncbi:MarR family winged helix-turn-helix transcriptional regulator [Terrarubrum flagellatum]|uniref:MarR family winged helix-turn-helix transcriptional regulator n=1 Tax=Terrirubrum flagellatum TaxID=2895980 RepID=UPI003144F08E